MKINYDYHIGSEGTFIFVHGSAGTRHKWRELMQRLPDNFGGIAMDLPGHGDSYGDAFDNVFDISNSIIELIEYIDPPRPLIWAGHSMGGAIVQNIAVTNPTLTDILLLIATGATLKVGEKNLEKIKSGDINPNFKRLSFSDESPEELFLAETKADLKTNVDVFYKDLLACDAFDMTNDLTRISQPTLIMVGEHDVSTPYPFSEYLHKNIYDSQIAIIPKAAHEAILEQPDAIMQAITAFLRNKNLW